MKTIYRTIRYLLILTALSLPLAPTVAYSQTESNSSDEIIQYCLIVLGNIANDICIRLFPIEPDSIDSLPEITIDDNTEEIGDDTVTPSQLPPSPNQAEESNGLSGAPDTIIR